MAKKASKTKKDEVIVHQEFFTEDGKKATLITKEGLKSLKEELEELKTVKRKEVAARIKEAISYGDLYENSEYEEAKNEQAFLEGTILELLIDVIPKPLDDWNSDWEPPPIPKEDVTNLFNYVCFFYHCVKIPLNYQSSCGKNITPY